jgi:aspartate/methionine/tyrosine aminotransferase
MFMWFRAETEHFKSKLEKAAVKVIPGTACGAFRGDGTSWFRMSMGHNNQYTEKALTALADALR